MTIDFYHFTMSPPCRAVLMTAKAIGVELNMIQCSPMKGENMTPEFLAINPQHCLPTIVDGDLKLWESRAISTYLVSQYGKDESLYPKEPKRRAEVDKMLYFDQEVIFSRFRDYARPVVFNNEKPVQSKLDRFLEGVGFLNTILEGRKFAAGDHITVADHSIVTNIAGIIATGTDLSNYANVNAYVERCKKAMPYFDEAQEGLSGYGQLFKSKLHP